MDRTLKDQLMKAMVGLKKIHGKLLSNSELSIAEIMMMRTIGVINHDESHQCDVTVSAIRDTLKISMPAVSQTLSTLEKKNLIKRDISASDRRKISVSLTKAGEEILFSSRDKINNQIDFILNEIGEDDAKELVRIMKKLNEIINLL